MFESNKILTHHPEVFSMFTGKHDQLSPTTGKQQDQVLKSSKSKCEGKANSCQLKTELLRINTYPMCPVDLCPMSGSHPTLPLCSFP